MNREYMPDHEELSKAGCDQISRDFVMLKPGLYEQVINSLLDKELSTKQDELKYTEKIDSAEASGILTRYLSEVIQKSLEEDKLTGSRMTE